ncbi:hypothetical protein ElyMa_003281100 [Elysia marginata]|uniref:Secreted protein n=1 Tax=Elysia marginata TaxID=1093978 RepID=A0AAV4J8X1_9GAST|nr:hypothetical protein ElyMa_003281100 [Elysia marginata]
MVNCIASRCSLRDSLLLSKLFTSHGGRHWCNNCRHRLLYTKPAFTRKAASPSAAATIIAAAAAAATTTTSHDARYTARGYNKERCCIAGN